MKSWTQRDVARRQATLEHESAHLAASIHVRAAVHEVEIRSPRTTLGYLGGCHSAALTAWGSAVVDLAGAVWTEMHPTDGLPEQLPDINSAKEHARDAGCEFEDLRRYVVAFLRHQEQNVRRLADRIAHDLPQSGILKGRRLYRIVDDFAPRIPRLDNKTMLAWGFPMTVVVRYESGLTIDEARVAGRLNCAAR